MTSKTSTLPDDPVELKKIIAQTRVEKESHRQHYESENELLREQIRHLYDKLFGRKSNSPDWVPITPGDHVPLGNEGCRGLYAT